MTKEGCSFVSVLLFLIKTCYMNYLQRLEFWGETHHPKYLDILRIALGIFICIKGIQFANDRSILNESMIDTVPFNSLLFTALDHYIIFAHIIGGFLIAVGLLTRVACLLQIPILLGALIFVHSDVMQHFSSFFVALITLLLLCYFLIIGSGPWSLDAKMWPNETNSASS